MKKPKGIKTVGYYAVDKANEYRALTRWQIEFWKDEPAFRAKLEPIYGDLVGDSVAGFISDMQESCIYKFADDYGIEVKEAAEALEYFAHTEGTIQRLYMAIGRALGIEVNL